MPESLSHWIDRIGSLPLPAMPGSISEIRRLSNSSIANHGEFGRVLARDPGFATAIFRRLGSLPHPPKAPIGTLSHAVALLGVGLLEFQAEEIPCIGDTGKFKPDSGLHKCYSQACHAAAYAGHWASSRRDSNPDEIVAATLIRSCGEMALWQHSPRHMDRIAEHMDEGMCRENASIAVLGFTLDQLNFALALHWGLPPLVTESLQPAGAFHTRSLGIMLASALAYSTSYSWNNDETDELLELVAEYLEFTTSEATARVHEQSADTARALGGLPLPLAAFDLLRQPPRPTPETPVHRATPLSTPFQPQEPTTSSKEAAFSRTQQGEGKSAAPQARSGLRAKLDRTASDLQLHTGMERVMFAVLSADRKLLQARFVAGASSEAPINRFRLSLDQRHLFYLLLGKPQGFWLSESNREKYLPAIPTSLRSVINFEGFFASSLFIGDKPLGILYADRGDPSLSTNTEFEYFKNIARQLSRDLSTKAA